MLLGTLDRQQQLVGFSELFFRYSSETVLLVDEGDVSDRCRQVFRQLLSSFRVSVAFLSFLFPDVLQG